MTTLKAVIGANLGDEGKGHMVDYFASKSVGPCIVVCTNGGAQRGHTVCIKDKQTHIFHHFGSGTLAGADTYLPKYFILNPIIFMQEYREFTDHNFSVYVNPNCLVSTPYDMIVNQIIEEKRGKNRHGSCGVGIWETVLRNEATLGELIVKTYEDLKNYVIGVRDTYFINRLKSKGIDVPKRWRDIYFSEELVNCYIRDFCLMRKHIHIAENDILRGYDSVIFENGQGLMLDQNIKDQKHSTPSNTGSKNIREIIDDSIPDTDFMVEVCYVTRSYLTRHGEGYLPYEVQSIAIPNSGTETNVWNKNQGVFRYGFLDIEDIYSRCKSDFDSNMRGVTSKMSFAITHIDEQRPSSLWTITHNHPCYLSDGPYRSSILEA